MRNRLQKCGSGQQLCAMIDAVSLCAITDERNTTILHGRIQDVIQLDALMFGLEIYALRQRRAPCKRVSIGD
jgi:hypothetical protein